MHKSVLNRFEKLFLIINEISFVRFWLGFTKYLHNGFLIQRKRDVIILSHFGLGDQIIIGNLLNSLALNRKVVLPVDSRYSEQLRVYYAYNNNVRVEGVGHLKPEFYPRYAYLKELRRTFDLPIIDIGRNVVYFLSFFNQKSGVSRLYYLAGWNQGRNFKNIPAFHFHFKEEVSNSVNNPYAFIDHHPGTNREIPNDVFKAIDTAGLDLKFNDMTLTLIEQLSTIINAQELHFVASAPFCLALAMPCKASTRVFYRTKYSKSVLGEEGSDWQRAECV